MTALQMMQQKKYGTPLSSSVSIGGRQRCDLLFADDIDLLEGPTLKNEQASHCCALHMIEVDEQPLRQRHLSRLCQNYRTISLICNPSKVMLRVILNRPVSQAEQILEEEKAGFRAQRSTTE